jgi:hypothetical protein
MKNEQATSLSGELIAFHCLCGRAENRATHSCPVS